MALFHNTCANTGDIAGGHAQRAGHIKSSARRVRIAAWARVPQTWLTPQRPAEEMTVAAQTRGSGIPDIASLINIILFTSPAASDRGIRL